jgi:hypothetical protein
MEENMFIKGTYSMWMEEIDMEELRGNGWSRISVDIGDIIMMGKHLLSLCNGFELLICNDTSQFIGMER